MDDIVFFKGFVHSNQAGSSIAINTHGGVYIGGSLAGNIPKTASRILIGYGAESRRLVFEPTDSKIEPGSIAIMRRGTQGIRLAAHIALKDFGLIPKAAFRVGGIWTGNRIVAILPSPTTLPTDQMPATPRVKEEVRVVDGKGGQPKPRTLNRKSEIVNHKSEVNHEERERHEEILDAGHCVGCGAFKLTVGNSMYGTCANPKSPQYGKTRRGGETCTARIRSADKGESEGEDEHEPKRGRVTRCSTEPVSKGPRPKGKCSACGRVFTVSSRGIYPHDLDGVGYAAGRGNGKRPCPGSKQPGKPL